VPLRRRRDSRVFLGRASEVIFSPFFSPLFLSKNAQPGRGSCLQTTANLITMNRELPHSRRKEVLRERPARFGKISSCRERRGVLVKRSCFFFFFFLHKETLPNFFTTTFPFLSLSLMPLAAAAAAARSPLQFGCALASGTRSPLHRCSSGSARRGTEVLGAKKKKTRALTTLTAIAPKPLHPSSHPASRSVALFASTMDPAPLYLGIDMGTSGGRAMVIDGAFFSRSLTPLVAIDLLVDLPLLDPTHPSSSPPLISLRLRHRRRLR